MTDRTTSLSMPTCQGAITLPQRRRYRSVRCLIGYNRVVTHSFPHRFNSKRAQQLLNIVQATAGAGSRIDRISSALVGLPYETNGLIGSADSPEVFTAPLDRYDCVTFVETVLAFAQSRTTARFLERLRNSRYASGKIEWKRRNHYMTEWIRNNIRTGAIARISALRGTRQKNRVLNVVPGFPARQITFACVPKQQFMKQAANVQTGDLIFFASTRPHLDVFHCGILINNGSGLMVRHASRSRGAVVEQKVGEFLKQNRMAGVIVVRPAEIS